MYDNPDTRFDRYFARPGSALAAPRRSRPCSIDGGLLRDPTKTPTRNATGRSATSPSRPERVGFFGGRARAKNKDLYGTPFDTLNNRTCQGT